jgi:protein TonB
MFESAFLDDRAKTGKPWAVVVSFCLQILLISIAVLVPLIYYDALPRTQLTSFLVAPPPPPPPPPPPAAIMPKAIRVIPRQFDAGKLMAPKAIPRKIEIIHEEELPPVGAGGGVAGGVAGGVPGGQAGGVIGSIVSASAPPPPPPPSAVRTPGPLRRITVGGNVQAAKLIQQPKPAYPPLARQARVQGTVRFSAVIGKDGTIQNLQVISGHPLLIQSAQEAVRRWVYKPTLLNGEPCEVMTQIDVNFTLNN